MSVGLPQQNASDRFAFGRNWQLFLRSLNEERIQAAEKSIKEGLDLETLSGMRFLDAGCGSGLSSLAAARLGAAVHSFDFDPVAVRCAQTLRARFEIPETRWTIEQGSVLDRAYLQSLGRFDVVYSWGVLHHTGNMWQALDNVAELVKPDGRLYVAIYNDQGLASRAWSGIKKLYNRSPAPIRWALVLGSGLYFESRSALRRLTQGQNPLPFKEWSARQHVRGMTVWHDLVDWVGGYPFEVATPDAIFAFYRKRGFELQHLKTCGGKLGCNEFVLKKASDYRA